MDGMSGATGLPAWPKIINQYKKPFPFFLCRKSLCRPGSGLFLIVEVSRGKTWTFFPEFGRLMCSELSMSETLYLETSVISYYTGRPSSDLIVLAHQEITRDWWPVAIEKYDLYISEVVIEEMSMGDPEAVSKRLQAVNEFPKLELSENVERMAEVYMRELQISQKAFRDALHLAFSSVHNIDYLVTWNCTHIANVNVIRKVMRINTEMNMPIPLICTPEEFDEGGYDVERPDS
jgi:predicted nucleic acid-binding protein